MSLTKEEITNLTKLCRIQCTKEEEDDFQAKISDILAYAELLHEVSTQDIPPCSQVIETLSNVMREDEIGPLLSREEFLANSPSQIGGMIKVPPVLNATT